MEKLEPLCNAEGIVNGVATIGKGIEVPQKLKRNDLAILLLGIYTQKIDDREGTDICISIFLAALLTVAQI